MEYRNKSELKRAIIAYLQEECLKAQVWVPRTVEDIVLAVDEKPFKVKTAINELVQSGDMMQEGDVYSLGPAQQALISKEIRETERNRLSELSLDQLDTYDPDYLKKAIEEAYDLVRLIILRLMIQYAVKEDKTVEFWLHHEGKNYHGTEDFSNQLKTLRYDDLVQHIGRQILRGVAGERDVGLIAEVHKLLKEKILIQMILLVKQNFDRWQDNMEVGFIILSDMPADVVIARPIMMRNPSWSANLLVKVCWQRKVEQEGIDIALERAQKYLRELIETDAELRKHLGLDDTIH